MFSFPLIYNVYDIFNHTCNKIELFVLLISNTCHCKKKQKKPNKQKTDQSLPGLLCWKKTCDHKIYFRINELNNEKNVYSKIGKF